MEREAKLSNCAILQQLLQLKMNAVTKVTLMTLVSVAVDGAADISQPELARLVGVSVRTVQRHLEALAALGYICIEVHAGAVTRNGNQNRYRIAYAKMTWAALDDDKLTPAKGADDAKMTWANGEIFPEHAKMTPVKDSSSSYTDSDPTEEEDDDKMTWAKIASAIEAERIAVLTPTTRDEIDELVSDFGGDWVLEAIRIAVNSSKRSLNYVRGICERTKAEGRVSPAAKPTPVRVIQTAAAASKAVPAHFGDWQQYVVS